MSLNEKEIAELDAQLNSLSQGKGLIDFNAPYMTEPDMRPVAPVTDIPEVQMPKEESWLNFGQANTDIEMPEEFSPELTIGGQNANDSINVNTLADRVNAYKKYKAHDESTLLEAQKISEATNIPENLILSSAECYADAKAIYEAGQKNVDYEKLFKENPALAKLALNGNDTMAAIAMNHVEEIKEQKALIDTFKDGLRFAEIQNELNVMGNTERLGGKEIDVNKAMELQKELEKVKAPSFSEDALGSIVGGVAGQSGQMLRSTLKGLERGIQYSAGAAMASAAFAAPTLVGVGPAAMAGARAGFGLGMKAGYAEGSYDEMVGANYLQLRLERGENGQPKYTKGQAGAIACAQAAVSAGIETFTMSSVARVLGNTKGLYASQIKDIIANATDKQSAFLALGAWLKDKALAVGKVTWDESKEEAVQSVSDDVIRDAADFVLGKDISVGPKEILTNAVENFTEALPTSFGFGMIGIVPATGSMVFRKTARALQLQSDIQMKQEKNAIGVELLTRLRDAVQNSKYFKKDAKSATEVLKNNLAGSGFEQVYIDTEEMRRDGNTELLTQVVNGLDISDETKQNIINGTEELKTSVGVETFCQLSVPEDSKLNEYISFDAGALSFAKNKRYAEFVKANIDAVKKLDIEAKKDIENIILEYGFAPEEREAAAKYIQEYGLDEAYGEISKNLISVKEKIAEIIKRNGPHTQTIFNDDSGYYQDITGLHKGLGYYTNPYDNNKIIDESFIGSDVIEELKTYDWHPYEAKSEPQWLQSWRATHSGRFTKADERQLIIDNILGNENGGIWEGAPENLEQDRAALQQLLDAEKQLEGLRDSFKKIYADDDIVARGLSKEGYEVYRNIMAQLEKAPTEEARASARMNAVLLARHADKFAKVVSDLTGKPYTAIDYINDYVVVDAEGKSAQEGGFKQPMQFDNRRYISDENGNIDIVKMNKNIFFSDGRVMAAAPIRLQLGFQVGDKGNGAGLTHILFRHKDHLIGRGFVLQNGEADVIGAIHYVVNNLKEISIVKTKDGNDRYVLFADGKHKVISFSMDLCVDPSTGEKYYTVVNMSPRTSENLKKAKNNTLYVPALRAIQDQQPAAGTLLPSLGIEAGTEDRLSTRRNSVYGILRISNLGNAVKRFIYDYEGKHKYDYYGNEIVNKENQTVANNDITDGDSYVPLLSGEGYIVNIDEYFNQNAKGQISFAGQKAIISLFSTADQSTFAHEAGHLFLRDLERLAAMEGIPEQIVKDYETVKAWINYNPKQLEEYKGTASYKEFEARHEAIQKAIKNKDAALAEKLKYEWAQERWARGWEEYLRSGKAPTSSLQRTFRAFKQWLTSIYKDYIGIGGAPTAEVKQVMDRMLATEEEIELQAKISSHESFIRAGGLNFLAANNQELFEKYWAQAKEEAKEKVLKLAMKDIKEDFAKQREETIKEIREAITEDADNNTVLTISRMVEEEPASLDYLLEVSKMTKEEYEAELKRLGGSYDAYIKNELAIQVAELDKMPGVTNENIKSMAEASIENGEYSDKLYEFEVAAMMRKGAIEERIGKMADKKFAEIEKALSGIDANAEAPKKISALQQRINDLMYTIRWNEAEKNMLLDIQKALAKHQVEVQKEIDAQKLKAVREADAKRLKEKTDALKEKLGKAVADFNAYRKEQLEGLRVVRDAEKGWIGYARKMINHVLTTDYSIKKLGSERKHKSEALSHRYESGRLMAKGQWNDAAMEKRAEVISSIEAEFVRKAEKIIDKIEGDLKKKLKTLKKNNHIAARQRYLYQSLMVSLGYLEDQEIPMPSEYTTPNNLLMEMALNGYEMEFFDSEGIPYAERDDNGNIVNINLPEYLQRALNGQKVEPKDLTLRQLQDLHGFMKMLYKSGSKQMITDKDGRKVEVDALCVAIRAEANSRMQKIQEVGQGKANQEETKREWLARNARKYLNANVLQMETVLEMMGPLAHQVYDIINDASMKELTALGATNSKLKAIMKETLHRGSKKFLKGKYQFGNEVISGSALLSIALNCGTITNKQRVISSFNVTEEQINEALSNLGDYEWMFVEGVWGLFEENWPKVASVQIDITGGMAKKEAAQAFSIVGKDGVNRDISGGYYPIRYDSKQGTRARQMQEANDIRGASLTAAGKNIGTGFTNERAKKVNDLVLSTDLGLVSSMLTEQVHFITMRKAYLDARAIVYNKEFKNAVIEQFGGDMQQVMEEWIESQWADNKRDGKLDAPLRWARTNMTLGALSYRLTTALINDANIATVGLYLGWGNTLQALRNFYGKGMIERANFIRSKSVFVAQRAELLDSNIRESVRKELGVSAWDRMKEAQQQILMAGFKPIMVTDMMLALPAWQFEYERVMREADPTKQTPEQIEADAIRAGDAVVRKCFGSGMKQDINAYQRGNEVSKMLTTFYSYFAVVHNMMARKVAEGRRAEYQGGGFVDKWAPIANGVLCMYIMQSIIDSATRQAMNAVGDEWDWEKFWKKAGTNFFDNIFGAIPVVRDAVPRFVESLLNERVNSFTIPILDISIKANNILNDIKNDKKDKIDVVYDFTKLFSLTTGFSDPLINIIPTTMRFIDEFEKQNVLDYLQAILLDKRLKRADQKQKK